MKYYLKRGDGLYQERTDAFGLIVSSKGKKFKYCLRSPKTSDLDVYLTNIFSVSKEKVYEHIDSGSIKVYYGSNTNRRKRK